MPLGHAFMILMELLIAPAALPYSAFGLGLLGLVIAVCGVFVKRDTPQTLCGLIGGLFLWTGWVEFLFMYYAQRFGAHPEIVNGVVSRTAHARCQGYCRDQTRVPADASDVWLLGVDHATLYI